MTQSVLEKWQLAAASVEPRGLRVPMHVLLGEAVDLARFAETYWEPAAASAGVVARPGLKSAGGKLPSTIGAELLELQSAVQAAQTAYLLSTSSPALDVKERAQFVLSELTASLEWLFDDGVEDEHDRALANLKAEHERTPDSLDALAAELADYAALAEAHRSELSGLGGFETSLIDEAKAASAALRERGAPSAGGSAESDALLRRNQLATLLFDKMSLVRSAARFVFRQQPDIARLATSSYERRRRAAQRRAEQASEAAMTPRA